MLCQSQKSRTRYLYMTPRQRPSSPRTGCRVDAMRCEATLRARWAFSATVPPQHLDRRVRVLSRDVVDEGCLQKCRRRSAIDRRQEEKNIRLPTASWRLHVHRPSIRDIAAHADLYGALNLHSVVAFAHAMVHDSAFATASAVSAEFANVAYPVAQRWPQRFVGPDLG